MMKTKFTMQYSLWLVCLALLFGQAGCRSDETQADPQPSSARTDGEKLLVASTSTMSPGIEKIEYNADQKPEKITVAGPGNVVNVSYDAGKVTYDLTKFGKVYAKRVYEFENGVAKKSIFYVVDSSGIATEAVATAYEYNAGKLHKEIITTTGQPGGFYYEYIYDSTNDNVAVREVHDLDGTLQEKRAYEYSNIPDKSVLVNQWNTVNADGWLFPQKSKYLAEKMTVESNGSVTQATFSYQLDEQGYVVSGKRVSDKGIEKVLEWTYKWQ